MKKPKENLGYKCDSCGQYDDAWTMYHEMMNSKDSKMLCWTCVRKRDIDAKPDTLAGKDESGSEAK